MMENKNYILFDLEGTVTDSQKDNAIYEGIPELLSDLQACGYHLAAVSSRPEQTVKVWLKQAQIAQYFDVIAGVGDQDEDMHRADVLTDALNRLFHYRNHKKNQVVMVCGSEADLSSARELGVTGVYANYGNCSKKNPDGADREWSVDSIAQLRALLIKEQDLTPKNIQAEVKAAAKEKGPSPIMLVWKFLYPFLLFYFAGEFFRQAFGYVVMFLAEGIRPIYNFAIVAADSSDEAWAISGNGNALIQMLTLLAVYVVLYVLAGGRENLPKAKETGTCFKWTEWIAWIILGMVLALGLNFIFAGMGWLSSSASYQEVADNLYAVGIPMGLLLYGICSPLTEELLFRGIIFSEVKSFMKPFGAALLSSALFGIYHGNMVQMAYSAIIGMVFAYAYHFSGQFAVPVVLHGVINAVVFLLSSLGVFRVGTTPLIIGLVFAMMSAVALYVMSYKRKGK